METRKYNTSNVNLYDPFGLAKGSVGFDTMLKRLEEVADYLPKMPSYPPFNVKKVDDEHYQIEIAVAGFGKNNLDIELKDDVLTISGKVESEEGEYLYKGIADRAFTRKFSIADSVVVKNAELVNGLLKIALERYVPEDKKPRKIDIADPFGFGEASKHLLTESTKAFSTLMGTKD